MSSRWTGFFIWALVAASAAFWGMKIFAATRPVPPGAQAPQAVAANGPMERLFGAVVVPTAAAAPVHAESERFQLVGVIAPPGGGSGDGYAVVAIDGQAARAWHVGSVLDGNTSLLSVSKRGAEFGPAGGPSTFSLQLPEPAAAETGTLPGPVSQPDQPQPQRTAQQPATTPQFAPQMPGQQPAAVQPVVPGRGGMRPNGRAAFMNNQNNGVMPPRMGQPQQGAVQGPQNTTEAPPLQQ